jgi:hypothetical protein
VELLAEILVSLDVLIFFDDTVLNFLNIKFGVMQDG